MVVENFPGKRLVLKVTVTRVCVQRIRGEDIKHPLGKLLGNAINSQLIRMLLIEPVIKRIPLIFIEYICVILLITKI